MDRTRRRSFRYWMAIAYSVATVVAGMAAGAGAHDFWMQPVRFQTAGGAVPTMLLVGHGPDRQLWGVDARRVAALRSLGADGWTDQRTALPAGAARMATLRFRTPGTHVAVLTTTAATSALPAARFNEYLKTEGLTPALRERARTGRTDAPGRELYSRCAKLLVQVGDARPAAQPHVTRPVGLTLEIVPERNPYTMAAGTDLPVRVFYEGRPLAGALVKLTDLEADAEPVAMRRTDRAGRATFRVPLHGAWLLNTVWTKPLAANRQAEFETLFSSLTFGFPAAGGQ